MANQLEVLNYWLGTLKPADWYAVDAEVDQTIRDRFLPAWEVLDAGGLTDWKQDARGALAYLLVADQFPRNMFRGDARAFATDAKALEAAREAIAQGWDMEVAEPERQFFYLPFMHSENPDDQEACCGYMQERMPENRANSMQHAMAHREVIRRFGRFPYRNAALGRETTEEEQQFLADGGYAAALRSVE